MGKLQNKWFRFLVVAVATVMMVGLAHAQMPDGDEGPGGPKGKPGQDHLREHRKDKPPLDPELEKRVHAIHMTAQAYMSMADMFEKAGNVDESVAQLQKIVSLHESVGGDETLPEPLRKDWGNKVIQVQMKIAKTYVKQNKIKEAENLLVDVAKKSDNPELQSMLKLELANIYRDQGKLEEAQKYYRQVIDSNAAAINKK